MRIELYWLNGDVTELNSTLSECNSLSNAYIDYLQNSSTYCYVYGDGVTAMAIDLRQIRMIKQDSNQLGE